MKPMHAWGRLSDDPHAVIALHERSRVPALMQAHSPGIAHGNGRSYGDVCLNSGGALWHTLGMDRFIRWDPEAGTLCCESGVLLRDTDGRFRIQQYVLSFTVPNEAADRVVAVIRDGGRPGSSPR